MPAAREVTGMHFDVIAALVAGFMATVAMTVVMGFAKARGLTRMPSFELVTGSIVSPDLEQARKAGLLIHYGLMGTVVFGIGYGAVFSMLDSATWLDGLIVGLIHGFVVGMLFMPALPALHPRVEPALTGVGGPVVRSRDGVWLKPPGVLGKDWGDGTPAGVVAGHVVYGIVAALVYGVLA
jgi:hypothetical protein